MNPELISDTQIQRKIHRCSGKQLRIHGLGTLAALPAYIIIINHGLYIDQIVYSTSMPRIDKAT